MEASRAHDDTRPVHFPGLNGIRFLAAFAVMVYHVEIFKYFSNVPSGVPHPFWKILGPQGVSCFFTLSGFLITYLLLEECRRSGSIQLRKFYVRRILRIWPLYYLILVLGFAASVLLAERLGFPHAVSQPLGPQIALTALMLPNLAWVAYGTLPFLSVLWSVGVEEQFYLGWPPLLRRFEERLLARMFGLIGLLVLARLVLPHAAGWLSIAEESRAAWATGRFFFETLKLECMALGGVVAYLFQRRRLRVLALLYHPATQLAAGLFLPIALWQGVDAGALDNVLWGTAYAVLILNVATNERSLLSLETPWLDALGRISFGLYVYHSFAEAAVLLALLWTLEQGLLAPSLWVFNVALYGISIPLTIAMASISYRYYERRFLDLKPRYTVVRSRSSVAAQENRWAARIGGGRRVAARGRLQTSN